MAWDAWYGERDDAGGIERRIAVADAECVISTGYVEVWRQTQNEVLAQAEADPDLIAYGALVEAALPRAEQVLAKR